MVEWDSKKAVKSYFIIGSILILLMIFFIWLLPFTSAEGEAMSVNAKILMTFVLLIVVIIARVMFKHQEKKDMVR